MCSASVDPIPSRMSTPKRVRNRSNNGAGNGSPAEAAIRTGANVSSGSPEETSAA